VAGVEETVTIVARQIEALFLSRPKTVLKQEFVRHLLSLYKHIIRYQILASCYYRRNMMREFSCCPAFSELTRCTVRFVRVLPKLDDVSEVLIPIRGDDTAGRNICQVIDSLAISILGQ
jgi:hypothetical protein